MSDENETPNPYAKGIEAGFKKPAPLLEGLKSAWLGLKNAVTGGDEKSKPSEDESEK